MSAQGSYYPSMLAAANVDCEAKVLNAVIEKNVSFQFRFFSLLVSPNHHCEVLPITQIVRQGYFMFETRLEGDAERP